jgi:hypothetical protein
MALSEGNRERSREARAYDDRRARARAEHRVRIARESRASRREAGALARGIAARFTA